MPIDGPRPIRREELPALGRLLNACFRARTPGNMIEQFPHFVNDENLENLFVIADAGELATHAGYLLRSVAFEGTVLSLALVGGVATAEHARGRGYATACMNALLAQAEGAGADLAWISGGRGLYTTRGAAPAGHTWVLNPPARPPETDATVRELTPADIDAMAALYRREPVRFLRPREDWARAFQCRWVMNYLARFWGVWRGAELAGYLVVNEQRAPEKPALLAEFAGDRADVAAALPVVLGRMGIGRAEVHVAAADAAGLRAFGAGAVEARPGPTAGTFLPLRMAPLLEKLRPRIAESGGMALARRLRFSESGRGPGLPEGRADRLRIARGTESVEILGRAELVRLLFGAADPAPLATEGDAALLDALRPAFPLPAPWYGLDFV